MGNNRWSPDDWDAYSSAHTKDKTRDEVFASRTLKPELDPKKIVVRESVDSDANPRATPVIVALDVTGSMGRIPHELVQGNLGTLMEELLHRRPVPDPHLMFMGVGDATCDKAPLQVTQFEADIRVAEQLREIFLEGGGGGNSCESYQLPWYFAATKTSIDSMPKRNKRGYLFTVGDEEPPERLTRAEIQKVFGTAPEQDFTSLELLEMAERNYHVFHIVVEQGDHYRHYGARVSEAWRNLMGQRVLHLSDYTRLAEVIVSTIQVHEEGLDSRAVAGSWSGKTALVVERALAQLPAPRDSGGTGLTRL